MEEREIHQKNIRDLQAQLQEAYVRINALNQEITELQKRIKDGEGSTSRNNS